MESEESEDSDPAEVSGASRLLEELEQQAGSLFADERDQEVADLAMGEYAQVSLAGRLAAALGHEVTLRVLGVGRLRGQLRSAGEGWCLLGVGTSGAAHGGWVVRAAAVVAVAGLPPGAVPASARPVTARLGLGSVLRRLPAARQRCRLWTTEGAVYDVRPVRVGADFVECRIGSSAETGAELFTFAAVAAVHVPPGVDVLDAD